ncbi:hypothetical protein [Leucothrix arctica]|uniref:Uncharacterized protein n=1 Tax=Leucothrix arctica TaxID=1481894 RepID=A0A317CCP0_9GAMM|nr:hypothetical protein [Leucothrix arctica]PWQ96147.1 hypothetical protein DKT75_09120 [Leucothrix arctica]
MKVISFLIFLFVLSFSNSLYASEIGACEVLNPQAKVSEKIAAEVAGSASTLFKLGAIDGNVKLSLDKETTNIFEKHKDANKTVIKAKLIYLYCRVIEGSDSLSDLDKLNAIRKLFTENDDIDLPEGSQSRVVYNEVEFTVKSCTQKAKSIKCKFTVKNTSSDKKITLDARSFLIDAEGDQYNVDKIKYGRIINEKYPIKLLVKGVLVRSEMTFSDVISSGDIVPLFRVALSSSTYVEFRSVPLVR